MQTISNKDLKNQQLILVDVAREALDEGRPIDALSLIERVSDFFQQNLITIMGVFCCNPTEELKRWALILFKDNLAKCSKSGALLPAANWVRNPKRSWFLPREFKQLIDDRRRIIEPDWDGTWDNSGIKGTPELLNKEICPEKIVDLEICLGIAGHASNANPWLSRYLALGGSDENSKYLKIMIAKVATFRGQEPSSELKRMLRRYCEVGNVFEIKKFLRHITPAKKSRAGLNKKLSRYALLVYCSCERLEHDAEDWMHIAKSASYLKHKMIQRIAQRGLAGLERTPSVHKFFKELEAINGEIYVTNNAKEDIGLKGNPIWQSVYNLLPVNGNAVKILLSYSKYEIETL